MLAIAIGFLLFFRYGIVVMLMSLVVSTVYVYARYLT